ncbi:MAG: GtrA family protein [Saprospiraceae bacterium]|nr:GtrA family protein [Saprospiraceae bacterium]
MLLKVKYASSSLIATLTDYGLYLTLVNNVFNPVISNIISSGTGMIINFALQKKYIFQLNRRLIHAFLLSVGVSIGGIALGTFFIYLLNLNTFFSEHQYITKLLVTGVIFFYNFYLKRYSFERRFL